MFEKSLENVGGDGYLGSAEVVEVLVRKFVSRVLEMKSKDDLRAACYELAKVFSGMDKRYTLVDGWSGRGGLMQSVSDRYDVPFNLYEVHLWERVFAKIAMECFEIVKSQFREKDKIDALIKYVTCVLIGTADALYGPFTWEKDFDMALEAKIV